MIGAILGLVSSLIGAATSASANEKSNTALNELAAKQRVPDSVRAGQAILSEQAAGDMPGMNNQLSDIESSQAQTINQIKDHVSGGGLLSALENIYTQGNAAKRGVYDANKQFQVSAKDKLAGYLGSISGGAESKVQDDLNSLALAKVGITQAGTQDKLNFMNTGLNSVSNDKGLLAIINKLLGNGGGSTGTSTGGIGTGGAAVDYIGSGFSNNLA